jgi:hypothetical protein
MGPAHGQAPPKEAQGVQRSQSSQVLSFARISADLFGSTADKTAELAYLVGSMADETSSDWANERPKALTTVRETERELSTAQGSQASAQGAGWLGPAHGQAPPKAAQGVQRSQSSQVLSERELSTAQGAGGKGPAHGQAPPEEAQGVQRSQSSQVLSFARTSTDLFGIMADETAELAYWVGNMADETSSDWADEPPEAAQGVQRPQNAQVVSLTHTSATKREISTAFRALGNHWLYQALKCTGKKKMKKSGCLSLPRRATIQSPRWSQRFEEEKRFHAAARVLQDQF